MTTPTAAPWHPSHPTGCRRCHRTDRAYSCRGLCDVCYQFAWEHGLIAQYGRTIAESSEANSIARENAQERWSSRFYAMLDHRGPFLTAQNCAPAVPRGSVRRAA